MHTSLVSIFMSLPFLTSSYPTYYGNHSVEFSMTNVVNETGHWNVHISLDKESSSLPPNWKANLKYRTISLPEVQKFSLNGVFSIPPSKPKDYELFSGIGYYKFYPESTATFDEAISICAKEGGHLAIINSEEEANVIRNIYARYPQSHSWAFLGFHDRHKQGNFITIFGKPLNSTGYNKWHPGEPDYKGGIVHCGCVHNKGLLGAVGCLAKRPFFCEYDISCAH